jgi:hypothetical protein
VQRTLDEALPLAEYARSLPRSLWDAGLPSLKEYPLRRARPRQVQGRRIAETAAPLALDQVRHEMRDLVAAHIEHGNGMLVLVHPPGAGKGYATVAGIQDACAELGRDMETPPALVWTAVRSAQIHDQSGLDLVPLHGWNEHNCRRFAEAQVLAAKGYTVRDSHRPGATHGTTRDCASIEAATRQSLPPPHSRPRALAALILHGLQQLSSVAYQR